MKYAYEGLRQGQKVKGTIQAETLLAAQKELSQQQILVEHLQPKQQNQRLASAELIAFAQGFGQLLKGGVPLAQAAALWVDESRAASVWERVFAQVLDGTPLADAMEKTTAFPPDLVAMARVGEETGTLGDTLVQAGASLDERYQLKKDLLTALLYPAIIVVVAASAIAVLVLYVLPIFEDIYQRYGTELPLLTQGLLAVLHTIKQVGPILLILAIATILTLRGALKQERFARRFHAGLLRLPLLGPWLNDAQVSQLAQTVSHLLHSGVPLLNAIHISSGLFWNRDLRHRLDLARQSIARGETASSVFSDQQIVPERWCRMLSLGEESGQLVTTFHQIQDFFARRLRARAKRMTAMMEPILIVALAVIIGGILVALYLPMFDIVQIME